MIAPGARAVLCISANESQNNAIGCDYGYFWDASITFDNTGDNLSLVYVNGAQVATVLDEIAYDTTWPLFPGSALQLDPPQHHPDDNDLVAGVVRHGTSQYGTDPEYGTPGGQNETCP